MSDKDKYLKSQINLSLERQNALYSDASVKEPTRIDELINQTHILRLNTYQSFVRNLFNPISDSRSLLLIHGTGTGKTISSLSIATEYQNQFRLAKRHDKESPYNDIRSIIILGYTKEIFKNELISHKEFGFTTDDELRELNELRAHAGESSVIMDKLNNLQMKLQRRVIDRKMFGIYQFFGYRQFFMRVFNLDDLQKESRLHGINFDAESGDIGVAKLREWVLNGKVRLNTSFIESLSHSLFICDEVHNVYYDDDVNIYGLAMQMVSDYFTEPKLYNKNWSVHDQSCIRWLLLSATPLTTSPMEVVPLLNLLNTKAYRITTNDVFGKDTAMTASGAKLIAQRSQGVISYVMDDNPMLYPTSSFIGTSIPGIAFLKFIRCPMSAEHQSLYDAYMRSSEHSEYQENFKSNTLKDMIFESHKDKKKVSFVYQYDHLLSLIKSDMAPYKILSSGELSSETFTMPHLKKYSSKYATMIQDLIGMTGIDNGKIFIYHPYVQSSGTNILVSILRANGFLDDAESPNDTSLCMLCGNIFKQHKNKQCPFKPIRFINVNGYQPKLIRTKLLQRYNNPSNISGEEIKILVGSKALRESHTLKGCRHLMVMHEPSNISELIQIIGRGVRKHSHAALSEDKRNISIHIYTHQNTNAKSKSSLSMEEQSYERKTKLYQQILKIENIFFNQSVDYLVNFRFKTREVPRLIGESFALNTEDYKKYSHMKAMTYDWLNVSRNLKADLFYLDQEISIAKYLIKRTLLEYQPVLDRESLIHFVQNPLFSIEADASQITVGAIEFALNDMCGSSTSRLIINSINNNIKPAEMLMNHENLITSPDGDTYRIMCSKHPTNSNNVIIYLENIYDTIDDLYESIGRTQRFPKSIQIDMETLYNQWSSVLDIDAIVKDIVADYDPNEGFSTEMKKRIDQFTLNTHIALMEYFIIATLKHVFGISKIKIPADVVLECFQIYHDKMMLITMCDTTDSIVEPIYKKFMIGTGEPWQDILKRKTLPKRVSLKSLPIGHYAQFSAKLVLPSSISEKKISWTNYSSIYDKCKWKFPHQLFFYYERNQDIHSIFKLKDLHDPSSRGVNPLFMSQVDLLKLAQRLSIKLDNSLKKQIIVNLIHEQVRKIESKYRKDRTSNKILFQIYETPTS